MANAIDLKSKLESFDETWSPRIIGEANGQYLKLARCEGALEWHTHEGEGTRYFYALRGVWCLNCAIERSHSMRASCSSCVAELSIGRGPSLGPQFFCLNQRRPSIWAEVVTPERLASTIRSGSEPAERGSADSRHRGRLLVGGLFLVNELDHRLTQCLADAQVALRVSEPVMSVPCVG
jgi:hypothetical protein